MGVAMPWLVGLLSPQSCIVHLLQVAVNHRINPAATVQLQFGTVLVKST